MRTLAIVSLFCALVLPARAEPFPVTLDGVPTIRLTLDREYGVIEAKPKSGAPKKDLRSFLFFPRDDQSSAVLAIGRDGVHKTEESIAKMYEGAKVTRVNGVVAGRKVEWWHYRDSRHLYSTCSAGVTDHNGIERLLYFDLVANTPERLAALETSFSGIELY